MGVIAEQYDQGALWRGAYVERMRAAEDALTEALRGAHPYSQERVAAERLLRDARAARKRASHDADLCRRLARCARTAEQAAPAAER